MTMISKYLVINTFYNLDFITIYTRYSTVHIMNLVYCRDNHVKYYGFLFLILYIKLNYLNSKYTLEFGWNMRKYEIIEQLHTLELSITKQYNH